MILQIIKELENKEFNEFLYKKYNRNKWYYRLRVKLTRGFLYNKDIIYLRKNIKIGRKKLIFHEVGHANGKKHTWKFTVMNPYWIFRLF